MYIVVKSYKSLIYTYVNAMLQRRMFALDGEHIASSEAEHFPITEYDHAKVYHMSENIGIILPVNVVSENPYIYNSISRNVSCILSKYGTELTMTKTHTRSLKGLFIVEKVKELNIEDFCGTPKIYNLVDSVKGIDVNIFLDINNAIDCVDGAHFSGAAAVYNSLRFRCDVKFIEKIKIYGTNFAPLYYDLLYTQEKGQKNRLITDSKFKKYDKMPSNCGKCKGRIHRFCVYCHNAEMFKCMQCAHNISSDDASYYYNDNVGEAPFGMDKDLYRLALCTTDEFDVAISDDYAFYSSGNAAVFISKHVEDLICLPPDCIKGKKIFMHVTHKN